MKTKSITALLIIFLSFAGTFTLMAHENRDQSIANEEESVVLLHGLGRSKMAMWLLAARLEYAGYDVHNIGYESMDVTPEKILKDISQQIRDCCTNSETTVHFVGHSLGGLLIRAYLQDNKQENLGHVVLIGSPNKGTPIVDHFRDHWLMQFAGPMTHSLGTTKNGFIKNLKDPYYPVGVIAGKTDSTSDFTKDVFDGDHDGLVPVESTKVDGMSDFIVIETSHSFMRYNEDVAEQTINFLRQGKFKK